MSSDRLPDLFATALEIDLEERGRFVAALRAEDPRLASDLERLLAAEATEPTEPSPLDRSPWRDLLAAAPAAGEVPARQETRPPAVAATVTPPAVCASCGTRNDGDARFCKQCGAGLATTGAES